MFRRPGFVGAILGALAALLVVGNTSLYRRSTPIAGPMLAENGGAIRSLVMQYTTGASFVWPVYRQFLRHQPASVTVYMACPGPEDFAEIQRAIGDVQCRVTPVFTGHEMTTWARDRWVELTPAEGGGPITLLAPRGELQAEIWPQRAGDSHVGEDLARALSPNVRSTRSSLYFDGGDLLGDDKVVFATSAVLRRNLQHTVADRAELVAKLQRDLGRPVILMDDAPDHHAAMYMMAVGDGRMLVGDPSLGAPLMAADSPLFAGMDGGPDLSPETQRHFDAVAKLAADQGYRVSRIPTIPWDNGKMYLTFVNVIMDVRDGRPVVYMPIYGDQTALNARAQAIWESLGYQVFPVDCSSLWRQGGALHCLVNVLERDGHRRP
jgi:hypothetical protein